MRRRFKGRPHLVNQKSLHLDNIALVPASLLPFKKDWERLVESLPAGDTLFLVPENNWPIRRSMKSIADDLRQHGHHIRAIDAASYFSQLSHAKPF